MREVKEVTLYESDDEAGVARVLELIEKVTTKTATKDEERELGLVLEEEHQRQLANRKSNEEEIAEIWKVYEEAMGYTVSKGVN